jgi:hypothetical protein
MARPTRPGTGPPRCTDPGAPHLQCPTRNGSSGYEPDWEDHRHVGLRVAGTIGLPASQGRSPLLPPVGLLVPVYTYEGTNEIHTLILGRAITGIGVFGS